MFAMLFGLGERFVPRLSRRIVYPLASAAGLATWRLHRGGRAIIASNIGGLLGLPVTSRSVRQLVRRVYRCRALNYADAFYLTAMSPEEVIGRTVVFGIERIQRLIEQGAGVVLVTAHLGNVDLGGNALLARGITAAVLTERIEPDWLLRFFTEKRARLGSRVVVYHPGVFPELLAILRIREAVAITCDWDMQGNGIDVWCAGHRMSMPSGPVVLALRARAPILPIFTSRLPDGRTAVYIEEPLFADRSRKPREEIERLAQQVADVLGRYLLRYPGQWVLPHRVWRP